MKKITVAILIFLFGLFLFVDKKNHHDKNNFIETEATEFDGYEKLITKLLARRIKKMAIKKLKFL